MIPETWEQQRARLEVMALSEADYVMGDQGRAAIKASLAVIDSYERYRRAVQEYHAALDSIPKLGQWAW